MKIRNGFVSNSSASSFIVKHIDKNWSKAKRLSKRTISKLVEYGFRVTHLTHPTHLDHTDYNDQSIWTPLVDKNGNTIILNYAYWVSCNEDEIISFLVKNNISFIASVHYGHQTWMFNKNSKYVMVFQNYGCEVETYYQDKSWDEIMKEWKLAQRDTSEAWRKIPVKDLLPRGKG